MTHQMTPSKQLVNCPLTTLEELRETGFEIYSYCKTCDNRSALDIDCSIEKLGRAFPLYLIETKLDLLGIRQCHPEARVCCLSAAGNKA